MQTEFIAVLGLYPQTESEIAMGDRCKGQSQAWLNTDSRIDIPTAEAEASARGENRPRVCLRLGLRAS